MTMFIQQQNRSLDFIPRKYSDQTTTQYYKKRRGINTDLVRATMATPLAQVNRSFPMNSARIQETNHTSTNLKTKNFMTQIVEAFPSKS